MLLNSKTHSIEELLQQCEQVDSELSKKIEKAVFLSQYAWKYRYPGENEKPQQEDFEHAFEACEMVYNECLSKL